MNTEIIPDQTGGLLGRHKHHDPRNWEYPVRTLLQAVVPQTQVWTPHWPAFDQGREGSCTAQAAAGLLACEPFRRPQFQWLDEPLERSILYKQAQQVDPFPETPPAEGSSTDAPLRALRDRGYIREWRWCRGIQDVRDTIIGHGPVAVGVDWDANFMNTDAEGYLPEPSGLWVGGHAFMVFGYYHPYRVYVAMQSWGLWGALAGKFLIHEELLDQLLQRGGEAATVVA